MRRAFVSRAVNGMSGETEAGTANLISAMASISDGSDILFEKKIQRTARAEGDSRK